MPERSRPRQQAPGLDLYALGVGLWMATAIAIGAGIFAACVWWHD